jgi:hypothetical protein
MKEQTSAEFTDNQDARFRALLAATIAALFAIEPKGRTRTQTEIN